MCEFISWIEKNDKCYFLTHPMIDSPQGKMVAKRFPGGGELIGHAAIRAYFDDMVGGVEREQTDFSSPRNFPKPIVTALKAGLFAGLMPLMEAVKLLTPTALIEYASIVPVYDAWRKAYDAWRKASDAWVKADEAYQKATDVWQKADEAYQKATDVWQKADDEGKILWQLFSNPENRIEVWR